MKLWRLFIGVLLATIPYLFVLDARAEYIDLDEEQVIATSTCTFGEVTYPCLLVSHGEKVYVVVVDEKGMLFECEMATDGTTLTIIWARGMI